MIIISSVLVPLLTDIVNIKIDNSKGLIIISKLRYLIFLIVSIIFAIGIFYLQKTGNLWNNITQIAVLSTSIYHLFYGDSDIRARLQNILD